MNTTITNYRRSALGALFSLCLAFAAQAANITVTNTNDNGPGSLRRALLDTPAGGSIAFQIPTTDAGYNSTTGVYTIGLAEHDDLVINASVTITGPGAGVLTIDGNEQSRIFKINSGTATITGLTLAKGGTGSPYNGEDYRGVAILVGDGAGLILKNATLTGNVYNYNVVFGGASSSITVSGCTFNNNAGYAVQTSGRSLTISDSVIAGNFAGTQSDTETPAVISNCTISGNRAKGIAGQNLAISNCNISANNNGGIQTVGPCTVTNTTITGNAVYGGIFTNGNGGPITISNCTITGNSEAARFTYGDPNDLFGGGGGILNLGGQYTVSNTIIAGNTSTFPAPDVYGAFTSAGYNFIGATDGSTGFGANGDQVGTAAVPLNPALGPLQDNGGQTFSRLPQSGSSVIDAGDPAFNVQNAPYDQRGYQRVANGRIDIGAVESGSYLNMAPTAVPGNPVSVHDTSLVTLNGSASFDDNTPSASLLYAWTFISKPAGSNAVLSNANTATPSFRPDLVGNYQVQLIVTDTGSPALSSTPKTVLVSSYNQAPVAQAAVSNPLPLVGQSVSLSSAGSMDPDGDSINYKWTITSAPAGGTAVIVSPTAATASITPDKAGTYTVTVTPSDFLGAGTPASVTFNATTQANYVHDQLAAAIALVQALPASQVTSRGNQAEFLLLLQLANTGAQQNCQLGYLLGIVEIDLAIIRTDGVPLRGRVDTGLLNRDWILDATAQRSIYAKLINARSALVNLASGH